nr:LysR family transcriptional regulator [uncultured Mediterraneibacter sp.]
MKIVQLEYFCAVSRYHSITQAAQKLYVTQPAISNAIKELEKEFSIQLFTRNKNHLSLTREGEIFYQKANALLQTIHQTSSELLDLGQQTVPIRIGIPPLLSTVFFPDMLIRFHKKYPDIPVELYEYGSIRAAELVQDETLDLALVNMNFYGLDKLNSFKILSDHIAFCVSGDHPLAEEKEVTMDMLQEESVILYNTDSVQNSTLNALFDQLEKKPNVILRASQLYTIRNFVQQNLGGAFLYASLLRNMPELIGLPIIPPIEQEIGLIWKKGKYVNSSVEKFLSFAEELLR